jgi:hypothetical protein
MKSLRLHAFVIACVLVALCSYAGAQALTFGQTQTGTIGSAAQTNSYTFSGTAGDVVDFTLATTSGKFSPKIQIYNSSATLIGQTWPGYTGGCNGGSSVELNTLMLTVTGTYTAIISDCSTTNTGSYVFYSQRTNNPSGAANLPFGQTQSGSIGSSTQSNSYTFSANAGDVVDFTLLTTSGSVSPKIRLYNPNGALNSQIWPGYTGNCNGGSDAELYGVTLPTTGTYTVLVSDCSDVNTGNYDIYTQRTNNPTGATPVFFGGQAQVGTVVSATQSNSYTFTAVPNNVVDFTLVTTSGSFSPKIRIYNPNGTLNDQVWPGYTGNCNGGSTVQLNTAALPTAGTYTVLVGDCSDKNTGNYNLSAQCFGNCPVTPTITWPAPAAITYGTALSAIQLDAAATVSGTTVAGTFVYTPPSGTVLSASLAPQTLSATFTPTDTTDYTLASGTTQLTVNKATPAINWATPAAITYGTALSATQLNASSTVAGSYVYTPPSGTVLNAGPQTLSVTLTPTDTTDYNSATITVGLLINPASQTISFTAPASPVTYGVSPIALSATSTSGLGVGFSVVSGPGSINGSTLTVTGAGTIVIAANQAGSTNYLAAPQVTQTVLVNKAVLTVSAASPTITYGQSAPSYTATYNGFQYSDTTAVLSGSPSLTTTPATPIAAGAYAITAAQGTLSAANYTFAFISGTLTINKAILTVTAPSPTATYGQALPAYVANYSGFQYSDTSAALSGSPSLTTTPATPVAAGTYPITAGLGTLSSANYTFAFVNGTLTINKAVLTVTAPSPAVTYGQTLPTYAASYSGFQYGDNSTALSGNPSLTTSPATPTAAGTYTITGTQGTLSAANYTFTFVNGTLTIKKATLTVTASSPTITYGQAVPAYVVSYSGFQNGDTSAALSGSASLTSSPSTPSAAGTYVISAAQGSLAASNYSLVFVNGALTINKAALTVTAASPTITYGQAVPAYSASYSGFQNGDTSAVLSGSPTLTTTPAAPTAAGTYTITAAPGSLTAANYTFTLVNGTLSIDKVTLTVTASSPTITYGQTVPAYTATYSGFQSGDTSAVLSGSPSLTTSPPTPSGAGTYPIATALGTLSAANYGFSFVNGTLTINPASQTISFTPPTTPVVYGVSPITLNATATSGLGVTFSVVSGPGTIGGSILTVTGAGTIVIAANQTGNTNYTAAPQVTQSVVVNPPPSFAISSLTVSIAPGATSGNTATITVTPSGGFTGSVSLSAAITSSPTGAQDLPGLSFGSTNPVNITGASAVTATLTISSTAPTTGALTAPERPSVRAISGGAVLACLLFFGIPARRRRLRTMLGLLVLLASLTGGAIGCGGGSGGSGGGSGNPGTTAGSYTVTVTGTSGNTTAQGTVTVTVQ